MDGCGALGLSVWRAIVRVLITGGAGQLATELAHVLGRCHDVVTMSRSELDVTRLAQLSAVVDEIQPELVVNAAAYTDVDGCESDRDRAFRVNALGARNVALAAHRVGAKLVHISTDYVFDGSKAGPYVEFDPPNPLTAYGKSKLLGEALVKEQTHKFFIVRTAWLYGAEGKNFVKTMLRLAQERDELSVVHDQRGTPTCVTDVALRIGELAQTELYGTYHCTSEGDATWYEFALEIFSIVGWVLEESGDGVTIVRRKEGRPLVVRSVSTGEYPRPAPRPRNSVLENFMLKLEGLGDMPDWREALRLFLVQHRPECRGG